MKHAAIEIGSSWAQWPVHSEGSQGRFKAVLTIRCAGTSIFSFGDRNDVSRPNSIAGDVLCLVSAAFYACYTVAIKKMLGDNENTNMVLFFGYVGLINLVALAPVVLILSLTSTISLAALSASMFGLVVAKGGPSCC